MDFYTFTMRTEALNCASEPRETTPPLPAPPSTLDRTVCNKHIEYLLNIEYFMNAQAKALNDPNTRTASR